MLTDKQRELLAYTQKHIGTLSSVREWVDDIGSVKIPIAIAVDSPQPGLKSYATMGLSDYSISLKSEHGLPLRVEFVGAARQDFESYFQGIGDCALYVAASGYQPMPGRVFPEVFAGHDSLVTTPHGLIWYPFSWEEDFDSQVINGLDIQRLTVIPITNEEFSFVRELGAGRGGEGVERIIDLFEVNSTDIWDLTRATVEGLGYS